MSPLTTLALVVAGLSALVLVLSQVNPWVSVVIVGLIFLAVRCAPIAVRLVLVLAWRPPR